MYDSGGYHLSPQVWLQTALNIKIVNIVIAAQYEVEISKSWLHHLQGRTKPVQQLQLICFSVLFKGNTFDLKYESTKSSGTQILF